MIKRWLKSKWINVITPKVFNTITANQLLNIDDHVITLKGIPLTREQINALSARAKSLLADDFFLLLLEDWKYLGQQAVWQNSETPEDVVNGKLILYLEDVMMKKLEKLAEVAR